MRLRRRTVIVLCLASLAFRLRFGAHDILDLATHEPLYDASFDSFGFARNMQDAAHDVCFGRSPRRLCSACRGGEHAAGFTTFRWSRCGPRRTPSRTAAREAGVRGVDAATAS